LPEQEKEEALMTVQEVATKLGYSTSMVHKLVTQNKIPHVVMPDPAGVRVRRIIRFKQSDIDTFIQERKAEKIEKEN
jgi:excisionase family DNA binding protein